MDPECVETEHVEKQVTSARKAIYLDSEAAEQLATVDDMGPCIDGSDSKGLERSDVSTVDKKLLPCDDSTEVANNAAGMLDTSLSPKDIDSHVNSSELGNADASETFQDPVAVENGSVIRSGDDSSTISRTDDIKTSTAIDASVVQEHGDSVSASENNVSTDLTFSDRSLITDDNRNNLSQTASDARCPAELASESTQLDKDTSVEHSKPEKSLEELIADVKEPEEEDHNSRCRLLQNGHLSSEESSRLGSVSETQKSDNLSKEKGDGWLYILGHDQLKKRVLKPGVENARPQPGQLVTVRCHGQLSNGTEIDRHECLKLVLGDGDFVQALDLCIPLMNKGEVCELVTNARFAYGALGRQPDVPPDATITYSIELHDYENQPDFSSLPVSDRVQLSNKKRERGNYLYARNEFNAAIDAYLKAIKIVDDEKESHSGSPAELQLLVDTRIMCYNNLAAAQIKIEAWDAAAKSCDQVLRIQSENVKALFRKGKCVANKGESEAAIPLLRRALQLEPNTKIIQQELSRVEKRNQQQTRSQREMYQKMLGTDKSAAKKKAEDTRQWRWYLLVAVGAAAVSVGMAMYRRFGHV